MKNKQTSQKEEIERHIDEMMNMEINGNIGSIGRVVGKIGEILTLMNNRTDREHVENNGVFR